MNEQEAAEARQYDAIHAVAAEHALSFREIKKGSTRKNGVRILWKDLREADVLRKAVGIRWPFAPQRAICFAGRIPRASAKPTRKQRRRDGEAPTGPSMQQTRWGRRERGDDESARALLARTIHVGEAR